MNGDIQMKPKWLLLGSIAALLLFAQSAMVFGNAEENRGAEKILLSGGRNGNIPFPHRMHQTDLNDCNICHSLFAQKSGSIDAMKASGELKKMQVMNTLCTKCHKQKKRAGEKAGPTSCKGCHRS